MMHKSYKKKKKDYSKEAARQVFWDGATVSVNEVKLTYRTNLLLKIHILRWDCPLAKQRYIFDWSKAQQTEYEQDDSKL